MISFPWYRLPSDRDLREKIEDQQRSINELTAEIGELRRQMLLANGLLDAARKRGDAATEAGNAAFNVLQD